MFAVAIKKAFFLLSLPGETVVLALVVAARAVHCQPASWVVCSFEVLRVESGVGFCGHFQGVKVGKEGCWPRAWQQWVFGC